MDFHNVLYNAKYHCHPYILSTTVLSDNLPLRQKIRILHDISKGLNYLHNLEPAIVHRDLNARNVFLTHNVCAKISDFGNARIIDLDPEANVCSHTAFPGTIEYMPPEAQTYHTQVTYGPSLDVFSFGHLSLLVFTQTQVEVLPPSLDAMGALSEVIKRKRAFDAVNLDLIDFPETLAIIKMSLHFLPCRVTATCISTCNTLPRKRLARYKQRFRYYKLKQPVVACFLLIERGLMTTDMLHTIKVEQCVKSSHCVYTQDEVSILHIYKFQTTTKFHSSIV